MEIDTTDPGRTSPVIFRSPIEKRNPHAKDVKPSQALSSSLRHNPIGDIVEPKGIDLKTI
jgi:hypothetical protein